MPKFFSMLTIIIKNSYCKVRVFQSFKPVQFIRSDRVKHKHFIILNECIIDGCEGEAERVIDSRGRGEGKKSLLNIEVSC